MTDNIMDNAAHVLLEKAKDIYINSQKKGLDILHKAESIIENTVKISDVNIKKYAFYEKISTLEVAAFHNIIKGNFKVATSLYCQENSIICQEIGEAFYEHFHPKNRAQLKKWNPPKVIGIIL